MPCIVGQNYFYKNLIEPEGFFSSLLYATVHKIEKKKSFELLFPITLFYSLDFTRFKMGQIPPYAFSIAFSYNPSLFSNENRISRTAP